MSAFDPNERRADCERYLSHTLTATVRLMHAMQLEKSTRDAPWRLDVEVDGLSHAYVLRLQSRGIEHEYRVLRAIEGLRIPAPRAYGWDPDGQALGIACYFYDFIEGESLLPPLLAGETWAEDLYIDTACALHSITREDLGERSALFEEENAADVLEDAYTYFQEHPDPVVEAAYVRLKETLPALPAPCFCNGDLWPDNLIVRDRHLAGVIDWAHAGFSDPIFEFLLPFFLRPELRGRGIEARYCQRMGFDLAMLPWYHGLEFFDSLRWVLVVDEPYEQHTAGSLRADLAQWLEAH
ncbi:MAG: phosphotransferase [Anaerolineae bacterium]|nr:phosphotransferase [Anaerolineae bacterium]